MRSLRRWGAALLVVIVALAGVATAVPAGQELVVTDAETGETLLTVPVEENTTVALEYTHSVEKNRVLDVYAVRDGKLVMTRMEFESYGAGLPATADVAIENGTFVFDPDSAVTELYVKPGRIAGHRLHVSDRTYDLVALSDARTVRLSVERRSALEVVTSSLK